MRYHYEINEENPRLSRTYIEAEEGETVIPSGLFCLAGAYEGEVFIPEGIEEIKDQVFYNRLSYHTYHFPKSLKALGDSLFSQYVYSVKVIYEGSSAEFMAIAKPREESVWESDGFDRYPYYSGGSRWVTYYYAFDRASRHVEVFCKADGVTLLYGRDNRSENRPPKIKTEE